MHQKLLINGFIINYESVRLILKEFDPLSIEQRARHGLIRYTYGFNGPNLTCNIDRYDKLKRFKFVIHDAIYGYTRKILWLFAG